MAKVGALLDSVHPLIWSALGFLVGVGMQYWLQVGRDRRQALEAAKVPIREWVIQQETINWALVDPPPISQIDAFESRLHSWTRGRFQSAMGKLADAHLLEQDQETGERTWVIDHKQRSAALRKLLKLTRPA